LDTNGLACVKEADQEGQATAGLARVAFELARGAAARACNRALIVRVLRGELRERRRAVGTRGLRHAALEHGEQRSDAAGLGDGALHLGVATRELG
jgi:hypothetical protein